MNKPFDKLYKELEDALNAGDRQHKGVQKYLHGIEQIREKTGKLRTLGIRYIQTSSKEVEYFRVVWPAFYGKLLLYIRIYDLELRRGIVPADTWEDVISDQENLVKDFFRRNGEFWKYYQSGSAAINEQFTRAHSSTRIFEPLSMVIDPDGATLASYRAACCLAMLGYGEWLRDERAFVAGPGLVADQGYSFGGTDADLAEWLFGLNAVEGILYKGQPADISRLQKWARLSVGREVTNIYDRGRVLRNRKKERLAFFKKMTNALEKKWNEADGKYE